MDVGNQPPVGPSQPKRTFFGLFKKSAKNTANQTPIAKQTTAKTSNIEHDKILKTTNTTIDNISNLLRKYKELDTEITPRLFAIVININSLVDIIGEEYIPPKTQEKQSPDADNQVQNTTVDMLRSKLSSDSFKKLLPIIKNRLTSNINKQISNLSSLLVKYKVSQPLVDFEELGQLQKKIKELSNIIQLTRDIGSEKPPNPSRLEDDPTKAKFPMGNGNAVALKQR